MKETDKLKLLIPEAGETFDSYDYAYAKSRELIDEVLAKVNHLHLGDGNYIESPTEPVTANLLQESANLKAGSYYYTYSWQSSEGETQYAPEVLIDNGEEVPPPPAPTLTSEPGGGTLYGDYYYYLTRVNNGRETTIGEASRISLPNLSSVRIQYYEYLPSVDEIKIYRRRFDSPNYYLVDTISVTGSPEVNYVDNGEGGTIQDPPDYNQTQVAQAVELTIPPAPTQASGLRIYRRLNTEPFELYFLIAELTPVTGSPNTYIDYGSSIRRLPPRKINTTGTWAGKIPINDATYGELLQSRVNKSSIYDDNYPLSGSPSHLEDDLNKMRTLIRLITGESSWDTPPPKSLRDLAVPEIAGVQLQPFESTYFCSFSPDFDTFFILDSLDALLDEVIIEIRVLSGSATSISVKVIQGETLVVGANFSSFPGYFRTRLARRLNNLVPNSVIKIEQATGGTAVGYATINLRGVACQL